MVALYKKINGSRASDENNEENLEENVPDLPKSDLDPTKVLN